MFLLTMHLRGNVHQHGNQVVFTSCGCLRIAVSLKALLHFVIKFRYPYQKVRKGDVHFSDLVARHILQLRLLTYCSSFVQAFAGTAFAEAFCPICYC
ncbi:hypothetical protein V5799_004268 [Amblyomma americanum]|uniref:Uncharacterized protein n=1 Tax=Amblyomma americanum TaxID=6943 RepID=A0AAQ4D6K3_AMBAM